MASQENDPSEGDLRCKDSQLEVYNKATPTKSPEWLRLSNFSIEVNGHSVNSIASRGKYSILKCSKTDGEYFTVPITMSDLDSNDKIFKVLSARKEEYGAMLDRDGLGRAGGKAKLSKFIYELVESYNRKKEEEKSPVVVAASSGLLQIKVKNNVRSVYVAGPSCMVSADKELSNDELDKIRLIWVGSSAEDFVIPRGLNVETAEKFLNTFINYHGTNKASPIALINYSWLSLHKSRLAKYDIRLSVMNKGVGKSRLRHQYELILPRVRIGDTLIVKEEETMSMNKLLDTLKQERHVVVQDPPNLADLTKVSMLGDKLYENKSEVSKATKAKGAPSTGVVFVLPNELKNLSPKKITKTFCSKSVNIFHERNNYAVEDFTALEKSIKEEADNAQALFPTLLLAPDCVKLIEDRDNIKEKYHKLLLENFDEYQLNMYARMIELYALLQAASRQWVKNLGGITIEVDVEQELEELFVGRCLPAIFEIIKRKQDEEDAAMTKSNSRQSPTERLADKLRTCSVKTFFTFISFGSYHDSPAVHFSKSLTSRSSDENALIEGRSVEQAKKRFLSNNSSSVWWNVKKPESFKRLTANVMLNNAVPEQLFDVIKEKVKEVVPQTCEVSQESDIKSLLDEVMCGGIPSANGANCSVDSIVLKLAKLTDRDRKKVSDYIDELVNTNEEINVASASDDVAMDMNDERDGDNDESTRQNELEKKKAEEEQKKSEDKRKKKAEEERRKSEAEQKKKAEEERKKSEEEQKKSEEERRKSEEEQKKKAEEERKKSEEERRKSEEEQKKAEDERKKFEEEQKKSEEERKKKSEEERKKKSEEERTKKAEEERKKSEEEQRKSEEEQKKAEEEQKRKAEEERKKSEEEQKTSEEEQKKKERLEKKMAEEKSKLGQTSKYLSKEVTEKLMAEPMTPRNAVLLGFIRQSGELIDKKKKEEEEAKERQNMLRKEENKREKNKRRRELEEQLKALEEDDEEMENDDKYNDSNESEEFLMPSQSTSARSLFIPTCYSDGLNNNTTKEDDEDEEELKAREDYLTSHPNSIKVEPAHAVDGGDDDDDDDDDGDDDDVDKALPSTPEEALKEVKQLRVMVKRLKEKRGIKRNVTESLDAPRSKRIRKPLIRMSL